MATAAKKRRTSERKKTQSSSLAALEPLTKERWVRDLQGLFLMLVALSLFLSFLASQRSVMRLLGFTDAGASSVPHLMGPVGRLVGTIMSGFFGWSAIVPVLWLGWWGCSRWQAAGESKDKNKDKGKDKDKAKVTVSSSGARGTKILFRVLGFIGVTVACATLSALWGARAGGGVVGGWLASPLEQLFHRVGGSLFAGAFGIFSLAFALQQSLRGTLKGVAAALASTLKFTIITAPLFLLGFAAGCVSLTAALLGRILSFARGRGRPAYAEEDEDSMMVLPTPKLHGDTIRYDTAGTDAVDISPRRGKSRSDAPRVVVQRKSKLEKAQVTALRKARAKASDAQVSAAAQAQQYDPPDLSLLVPGESTQEKESDEELLEKSRMIEGKLKDFGILGRVTQVHPGPVITLFEFEPAAGIKVGRIAALQDDLAMSLRAVSIRIIAPIPKRGTVGIEVPNRNRDLVRLRDVLESAEFIGATSSLTVAVGKDTYGESVVVDISSLPHLLMAGATGTGKSVGINAMLLSLLYRANPAELGLILIDPKILELSVYEGIPHLRVPVVTSPRQAKAVLEWAINEMNRRYRLMQRFGVRSIDGYNRIVTGEAPNTAPETPLGAALISLSEDAIVQEGTAQVHDVLPENGAAAEQPLLKETLTLLPKIVIVIDELADLMFSVGREIEDLITRLAQKARASGIHLIVATQRPSVDVITGLIKANFPARLSFRVTSRVDSRTILDSMGAEKLLGKGDMLFMLPGAVHVRRVHGAFVSDAEVQKVVSELKKKHKPFYDQTIVDICEKALKDDNSEGATGAEEGGDEYDEFYDRAVEFVLQKGQASTSLIQRAFRIGYNRAARIVEMMEKDGIVGPLDGAKPRPVLHAREEALEE